jgi:hypothetical protein
MPLPAMRWITPSGLISRITLSPNGGCARRTAVGGREGIDRRRVFRAKVNVR